MDNSTSMLSRPSPTSQPSPTNSQKFPPEPDAARQMSSLEEPPGVKAELVPRGGSPQTLGATVTAEGINFAVYSEAASALYVSLYDEQDQEFARFELDGHDDNIHHALISGIGPGIRYG